MPKDYDNTNNGVIYPREDGTWTGSFTLPNNLKAHASIVDGKLIVSPINKNGNVGKRPVFQSRIVRRSSANGPAGYIPDLDTPLCIWRATDKVYGTMYLQIKPDRAIPVNNTTLPF